MGRERYLLVGDLLSAKAKKNFKKSIEYYDRYLGLLYSPEDISYNSDLFNEVLECYTALKKYGVDCEIIAYDILPIDSFFGYSLELYGIDVVNDFVESLLSDNEYICDEVKNHLNKYGLLDNVNDVSIVLKNSRSTDSYGPCWIYKVNVD